MKASSPPTWPPRRKDKPVIVAGDPTGEGSVAPYFLEEVRKHLEAKYGAKALYESGLTVKTGARRQAAAGREQGGRPRPAPRRQAPRLSQAAPQRHRRSARRSTASRSIAGRGASAKATSSPRSCAASPTPPRSCASAQLSAELTRAGMQWTNKKSPKDILKAGDLIDVEITQDRRQRRDRDPRTDADPRRRAGRDRQPHRRGAGDGRRLQLLRAASSIARRRPTGRWARR